MKQVRQHFAYDENGNLVEIHSTHKGDGHVYYCPYCKQELTPKRGEHNEWHFAHKADNPVDCSYDNYLHTLAIKKIYDWYLNSETVNIQLCNTHKCEVKECRWKSEACEKRGLTDSIDLKTIYDTAEVEKDFETSSGRFRADILLSSAKYPKDPIFLEVYVTHACSPEKIASGLRIIEIRITSEADIDRIIASNVIKEHYISYEYEDETYLYATPDYYSYATFYGFKPTDKYKSGMTQPLQKFILYPSQKRFVANVTCRNYGVRKGMWEVTSLDSHHFYTIPFFHACLAKAFQMGYIRKACKLCKYMGTDRWMDDAEICNLSRKFGTERYCKDNDEANCQYFRVDKEHLEAELKVFDEFQDKCKFEIWEKEK